MRKQGIEEFQVEKNGYREEISENMTPLGNRNEAGHSGAPSVKEENEKW